MVWVRQALCVCLSYVPASGLSELGVPGWVGVCSVSCVCVCVCVCVILGMGFLGTGSRSLPSSLALELTQPWAGLSKAPPQPQVPSCYCPNCTALGGWATGFCLSA